MKYQQIYKGFFLSRPNRFIAMVDIGGKEEKCHVKNTGRCRELLLPGAEVYLEKNDSGNRKTRYDLVGVKKGNTLINMDSQAPNKAVQEWLTSGGFCQLFPECGASQKDAGNAFCLKPECRYKNSRFDFYMEEAESGFQAFIEVKGVTLEQDGVAEFPDAPTERGIRHIEELADAKKNGYEAFLIFVIQMKGVRLLKPNDRTHKAFGDALRKAKEEGVHILAYDCQITTDSMVIDERVPVAFGLQEEFDETE